jgi:DNA-binding PadR family transcriptional regulator
MATQKRPASKTVSRLELLILQFLNWKEPLYAYEIEKIIEHIHAREWLDVGFSTIYYALKRLHKKGFVTRKKVLQNNKPPRVLYTKTHSGNTALKQEVARVLNSLELPKSDYNQALLSIDIFEKDEILTSSRERLAACQKALREIQHAYERQHGGMGQFILSRNMRLLEAEIAWLTDWIDTVKNLDSDARMAMQKAGEAAHFEQDHSTLGHPRRKYDGYFISICARVD